MRKLLFPFCSFEVCFWDDKAQVVLFFTLIYSRPMGKDILWHRFLTFCGSGGFQPFSDSGALIRDKKYGGTPECKSLTVFFKHFKEN